MYLRTKAPSSVPAKSKIEKVAEGLKGSFSPFASALGHPSHPDDRAIGVLGILHPTVLEKFEIGFPCSALDINLEPFKKEVVPVWLNP